MFGITYAEQLRGKYGTISIAELIKKANLPEGYHVSLNDSINLYFNYLKNQKNIDDIIIYEFCPQVFTEAYIHAWKNPQEPTFLVIEEINRGNCAQIFGDLFQLLDRNSEGKSEYKIKADKDLANYLKEKLGEESEGIKDGKLCLPPNLNILATMNTSDQSLFPMDTAFQRRWEWECVPIDYENEISKGYTITIGETEYNWTEFIKVINEKIYNITKSEDKQLGNFFIKSSIDEKQFKNKVMFYLWNEILKDEHETKTFFYKDKEQKERFTFNDLYSNDATQILQGFMASLGFEDNKTAE